MPGARVIGAALLALAWMAGSAAAQEPTAADAEQIAAGQQVWKERGDCGFCHGWQGNGQGHPRSPGDAPSLWTTQLDHAQLVETITCGRPATAMPFHDRMAYRDPRCYGLVAADLGDDVPTRARTTLQPREIEAVATYVEQVLKGRTEVTLADCESFWGAGAGRCAPYRQ